MTIFIGTLIVVVACCAAMSLGLILSGRPLTGGCGKRIPGTAGCNGCPNKAENGTCRRGRTRGPGA